MAGDDGRGRRARQTAAVILVLCALAQFTTCVSLQGLSNVKQDEVDSGATVVEERTGRVYLNGKELNSQSESAVSATENDGLLHTDLDQLKSTGRLEQTSQQGDNMADEAAWRHMTVFLHCGQRQMKIKAMGPEAVHLKLDMGNTPPMPLFQVPEHCGFSMRQNALGFILVVPYDGCNVMQEDESFVFPMTWLETAVKFTCPMSGSSTTPPPTATPKPAHQPRKLPFSLRPWGLNRHKRQLSPTYYDPRLYMYYYNMMMTMTTAKPTTTTTTTTTKPTTTTTKSPSVQPLPSYPYSYNTYLYYYCLYYPQYCLPQTTTAQPTTASTTTTTPKPGPGPDDSDVYYYPIIQHFYGSPPYAQKPQTTPPTSPTTTMPGDTPETDPTTAETDPTTTTPTTTTTTPTTTTPTTAPTTTPTTTKACSTTKATTTKTNDGYPGPMPPLSSYYQNPYPLQVAYNRAAKIPDDQKYMPQYGFKSGLEAQANPHPGFQYWQPVNWPQQTGEENPQ